MAKHSRHTVLLQFPELVAAKQELEAGTESPRPAPGLQAIHRACVVAARRAAFLNHLPRQEDSDIEESTYGEAVQCLKRFDNEPQEESLEGFTREIEKSASKFAKQVQRRHDREVAYPDDVMIRIADWKAKNELAMTDEDEEMARTTSAILGPILRRALDRFITSKKNRQHEMIRDIYYGLATVTELKEKYGLANAGAVHTALSRARKQLGAFLIDELKAEIENEFVSEKLRDEFTRVLHRLTTIPQRPVTNEEGE